MAQTVIAPTAAGAVEAFTVWVNGVGAVILINPFVHLIAALAVCSRLADLWTTYLVTPTLKLEANSLARRFGWRFAVLTIFAGLVPYVWPPLGVMVLTTSFTVSAFNASKIVMARALGEDETTALFRRVILATPPWPGLLFLVMPGILVGVLAGCILLFYPYPDEWGFYFGVGLLGYTGASFVWNPVRYFGIRAEARRSSNDSSDEGS